MKGPAADATDAPQPWGSYCSTLWWRWLVFPCNGAPVEWNWQGKTEVLGVGKNLSQCHFVHHKSHMDWPGIEPGLLPVECFTNTTSGVIIVFPFSTEQPQLVILQNTPTVWLSYVSSRSVDEQTTGELVSDLHLRSRQRCWTRRYRLGNTDKCYIDNGAVLFFENFTWTSSSLHAFTYHIVELSRNICMHIHVYVIGDKSQYTEYTQNNGAVSIVKTIETAPFFCVYPVFAW
jgi:hypothetical protein